MNSFSLTASQKIRLTYLLAYACAVCWVPVLSLYYQKAGLNGLQLGILSSIPPAITLLVQPFWGIWADTIGRKKLLVLAMSGALVIFQFFPEKAGFTHLFILTLILGVVWCTIHPLIDCITLDLFSKSNDRVFSFYRMWGAIGWSSGSLLLSYIDLSDNLVFNFRLATIFLGLSLLVQITLKVPGVKRSTNDPEVQKSSVTVLWRNLPFTGFLIILFFIAILTAPIWYYSSILYSYIGASSSLISLAYGLQGLVEIPFFLFANRIIKKFGIQNTLIFTIFASSLRCMLYGIIQSPQMAIGIELLQGISWSLLWACCVEYTNELVPACRRATGQSLMWAVFLGGGTIVGNIWTGYLFEKTTIQTVFLLNSAALLLFSFITILLMHHAKKLKANKNEIFKGF